ncbi:MAG: phosphate signaling complex PhoU family protein [Acidimicrobiales bacterium]
MATVPSSAGAGAAEHIEAEVCRLFALVREALSGATYALLNQDREAAARLVAGDQAIDDLASEVAEMVRHLLIQPDLARSQLPYLVALLQMLPELERSADLAEHIAQRAGHGLGRDMTPQSRGIVQRMAEVGLEMWALVAEAYVQRSTEAAEELDEADTEIDVLHNRLTGEVAKGEMPVAVASEVTLIARFYERLGDHAVNLGRRIARLAAGQV